MDLLHHAGAIVMGLIVLCALPIARGDDTKNRTIDCDAVVQSHKRGLCANHLSPDDFRALTPGVSWFYNWHYETKDIPPPDAPMDFVPMVWGNSPASLDGLKKYLAAGNHPRAILGINEPNLRGQAFISPQETAAAMAQIAEVANHYKIPLVGPNMALGSSNNDSITAFDPLEKKNITYTFMVPFLKAYLFYAGKNDATAMAFHSYGSYGEMQWAVGLMHKEFATPLWVTEYAQWKTSDDHAALVYLVQATDFLERFDQVQAYSWFKERVDGNKRISLLETESGKLTPMGRMYVSMPVHDADLYYRIPGKLSAARYVAMQSTDLWPDDTGITLHLSASKSDAWLKYNLRVPQRATYAVKLNAKGTGPIQFMQGQRIAGTTQVNSQDWTDVQLPLELSEGNQQITLKLEAKGLEVRWLEFVKK